MSQIVVGGTNYPVSGLAFTGQAAIGSAATTVDLTASNVVNNTGTRTLAVTVP